MKLSDIYNSICIDSSVENKNCILLKKIVFYLNYDSIRLSARFEYYENMCGKPKILVSLSNNLVAIFLNHGFNWSRSSFEAKP